MESASSIKNHRRRPQLGQRPAGLPEAAALDNLHHVPIAIHNYRWRLGLGGAANRLSKLAFQQSLSCCLQQPLFCPLVGPTDFIV